MYPEIFSLGPFQIRGYGLMLALSFFSGIWYISRMAGRDGKQFEQFLTLAYIMIVGGIVGARLFYVVFHLDEFAGNWTATFNPFASDQFGIAGLTLYGGVLLAIAGSFLYCRIKGLSVLGTFDYFAPTLGLGLAFTRIGCFLNGCCFGTPSDLPWGISFPAGSIPHYVYGSTHLHPAQLYSSLYGLLLFIGLHFLLKRKQFAGQVVAILFMVEAIFRFGISLVRFQDDTSHIPMLGMNPTYNQLVAISLFLLGAGIYAYQSARRDTIQS